MRIVAIASIGRERVVALAVVVSLLAIVFACGDDMSLIELGESRIGEAQSTVDSFMTSLAEDSAVRPPDTATVVEDSLYWAPLFAKKDDEFMRRIGRLPGAPPVHELLSRPLVVGTDTIVEKRGTRADGSVALAECRDGTRTITYASTRDKQLSPFAVVFFRYHELGHHQLHITCKRRPHVGWDEELEADCAAAMTLAGIEGGKSIVDITADRLFDYQGGSGPSHPPPDRRGEQIWSDECAPTRTAAVKE